MKMNAFLVAFIVLTVPFATKAQKPCACADKADLINQLNKASAALNAIQQFSKAVSSKVGEIASPPNPASLTWKQAIDGAVFASMNAVEDLNAQILGISIDSGTCNASYYSGTACLKSIAHKIVSARQAHCSIPGDTLVVDYLSELSDQYRKQITEILKTVRDLPKGCSSEYWFGVITYEEITKQTLTVGKETMENEITRTGRLLLNGKDMRPMSSWNVGGKYVNTKTGSSWSYCTQSDRRINKQTPYETSFRQEWDRSGSRSLNIDVEIGEPENNRVPVGFTVPVISVLQKGSTVTGRKDGCPNGSTSNTTPMSVQMDYSSSQYSGLAPYFMADPEKISGSDIKEIPDGTIRTTFNLFRIGKPKLDQRPY